MDITRKRCRCYCFSDTLLIYVQPLTLVMGGKIGNRQLMTTFEEILSRDGRLIYKTRGVSMQPMLYQNRDLVIIETFEGRLKPYVTSPSTSAAGSMSCTASCRWETESITSAGIIPI